MSEHCNKRPLDVPVPTSEPPWLRSFRIPGATGGDPQIFPPACAIPQSSRMRTNIQGEFCLRSPRIAGCVRRHRHFHRLHQGSTALSEAQLKDPTDLRLIFRSLPRTPPSMVPWQRYRRHSHWRHPRPSHAVGQLHRCTGLRSHQEATLRTRRCGIACKPLHELCRLKPALSPGRLACGKSLVSRPRPARFQPCTFSTKQCWTLPSSS